MSNEQIRRDLTVKIGSVVGETLKRELGIAGIVLKPGELCLMRLQIASAVMLEAIASAVICARPEIDRSIFWDETQEMFFDTIRTAKPTLLAQIDSQVSAAGAGA